MKRECVKIWDFHTRELIKEANKVKYMLKEGQGYMDDNDLMQFLLLLFQRIGEETAENAIFGKEEVQVSKETAEDIAFCEEK